MEPYCFIGGLISNGTALTKEFCIQECKPMMMINILDVLNSNRLLFNRRVKDNLIQFMNVADPRESESAIYNITKNVLRYLL